MGATVSIERCPCCGAPAREGARECSYCRVELRWAGGAPSAPEPAKEVALASQRGRGAGLLALVTARDRDGWAAGTAAFARWGAGGWGSLSSADQRAAKRLGALLGAAYVGAL